MRAIDNSRKTKRTIKVIGGILVSAALLWFIKLTLWGDITALFSVNNPANADVTDNITASQQHELLMQDEMLHGHLNSLQKLDKVYSSFLTDTTNKNGLIEINDRISLAEKSFGESIDSICKEMINSPNRVDENLFANMINSFRLALENRRSINNLRDAISNDKTTLKPDQISMLKVKNELLSKDTKIANLENALKVMQNNLDKRPSPAPAIIAKAPANIVKEEDNSFKEKITEKDNKIANLTATNNMLQKEYDRLVKQFNEARKNLENNDFKSKNVSLENKVDELNTELRLAQVDCNLARADANQIISNSKQRRQLLSEALSILNSFSKSENTSVQKKVQDKIARLNQVAKNYRD